MPHFAQRLGEIIAGDFIIFDDQNAHGRVSYLRSTAPR
jgi:hypothetical protein